jgi:FlaG/FlaF family flagellin (archaellin)
VRDYTDNAVSPVVGVMLMLVVVIIIAAVVSGFSGGLLGSDEKAPQLAMDVKIANNGYWPGTYFSARVTGVEKGIPTKDLKIVTKWVKTFSNGTQLVGGATVLPLVNNTNLHYSWRTGCSYEGDYKMTNPYGFGSGVGQHGEVAGMGSGQNPTDTDKWFGNYDLVVGTSMWAEPFGANTRPSAGGYSGVSYNVGYGVAGNRWNYTAGQATKSDGTPTCAYFNWPTDYKNLDSGQFDGMMAILGPDWSVLGAGDTVSVSVIHTPSGKTICHKDVIVEA